MGCRSCGSTSRRGKYCVDCGERTPPRPYLSIILFASLAIIVLLATVRMLGAHEQAKATMNISITEPESCNGIATIFVHLADEAPIADASVAVYVNGTLLETLQTDQNGRFFTIAQTDWCKHEINISAVYAGDRWHLPASTQSSVYATISCSAGLVPVDGACVSREQRAAALIARLQKSIVKIQHPDSRGSGVIIAHSQNTTFILTNKHVIEEAINPYSVKIISHDGKRSNAHLVYVAPNDMDLAVIEVYGVYGIPAEIQEAEFVQGNDVVALGSPHGIQGSVSKGIISNAGTENTPSKYRYKTIQTDAAINKGNSGGGLFLESNGQLIGINSFKMKNAEGMNFAIDISELSRLPPHTEWKIW